MDGKELPSVPITHLDCLGTTVSTVLAGLKQLLLIHDPINVLVCMNSLLYCISSPYILYFPFRVSSRVINFGMRSKEIL